MKLVLLRCPALIPVIVLALRFPRGSNCVDHQLMNDEENTTKIEVPRESSQNRQMLVGYWGQNGAGPSNGRANYEKPLKEVCATTKFDILAVSFLTTFWNNDNKDSLPGLNFAFHCEESISPEYPSLLRCPKIEEGIKECQRRGKKVLMSIGGATGDGTLPSPAKAKELANTLFDLFLGGSKPGLRPFGTAVMDGIDLDIEGGRSNYYPDLIRELRLLMDADSSKHYLITGAPQCPFPDHYLGPVNPGTGLKEAGNLVDHLYVQFYNNYCHTGAGKSFHNTLKQWLDFSQNQSPKGPLIFIGVPAATKGASGAHFYRPPSELKLLYDKVKNLPGIGGIMLWDVSWDQNNVINGRRYSDYVVDFLGSTPVILPKPVTGGTTQAPPSAGPTAGPFSCSGRLDGTYANPSDCAKYYTCFNGVMYNFSCPLGLLFNGKTCDWPANVQCA